MKQLTILFVSGLVAVAAPAAAQIYRCEGAGGVIEYSNAAASGKDRNCRPVDLPSPNTIPAPKLPAGAKAAGSNAKPSPDSFPKVDAGTQKTRDSDRRRILEDELRREESKLTELKSEFKNGDPERRGDERNYQKYLDRVQRLKDDIGRTEGNVASLRRELGAAQ